MECIAENIKENIKSALALITQKKYQQAEKLVNEIYEESKTSDFYEGISIALTLNSFLNYSINGTDKKSDIEEGYFMVILQHISLMK